MNQGAKRKSPNTNVLYAIGVAIWIVAIWVTAFYVASAAVADESAGVGGNSFLLGSSLATAGVLTIFSVHEFMRAYRACFVTGAEYSADGVQPNSTKEKEKNG